MPDNPLLSICIPTYNSARLLQVMLQALLPQTEKLQNAVEVIVSDNFSQDETNTVLKQFQNNYTLHYSVNSTNTGPIANIIKCTTELASGEFIWVLGSHNLVVPDAISYILDILEKYRHLNIIYTNFNCARYPEQWPQTANGGFKGEIDYISNTELENREVKHWYELVNAKSALCTQLYAHIVKRKIWVDYWSNRSLPEPYASAAGTYPHTTMIAETVFSDPSFYIGRPLITIFNGAQTWNDLQTKSKVYFIGLAELITLYKKNGLKGEQLKNAKDWANKMAKTLIIKVFKESDLKNRKLVFTFIGKNVIRPYWLKTIWQGYLEAENHLLAKAIKRTKRFLKKLYQYFFYNWRPARILRRK